jgi:hypothetical protein
VDVNAQRQSSENEIGELYQPTLKYTLLEGMFNRDYLCMYITLATNRCGPVWAITTYWT